MNGSGASNMVSLDSSGALSNAGRVAGADAGRGWAAVVMNPALLAMMPTMLTVRLKNPR
jgi:hypothetical protein